jgi:hypothetical protein
MRKYTIEKTVYKFDELSPEAQEKAIYNLADINVDYDWWDATYEDAENIGLKITSFDLDRNRHAEGMFILPAYTVIQKVMEDHGESCETYKTAAEYKDILSEDKQYDEEGYVTEEYEKAEDEFLKYLLKDYSIMLQKEYEYLTSDESIKETIEANDYEFDENGNID